MLLNDVSVKAVVNDLRNENLHEVMTTLLAVEVIMNIRFHFFPSASSSSSYIESETTQVAALFYIEVLDELTSNN